MNVSIIIVNYNTFVLIKNLLKTIEDKTEGVSCEVIVVDNNPTTCIKRKKRRSYILEKLNKIGISIL